MKKISVIAIFCMVMLWHTLYAVDSTWGEVFLKDTPNYEIFHYQNRIAIVSDLGEGSKLTADVKLANHLIERYVSYLPIYVQMESEGRFNGATFMRKGESLSTEKVLGIENKDGILEVVIEQQVGTPKGVGMDSEVVYAKQKVYEYQINWNVNNRVEKVTTLKTVVLNKEVANRYDAIYEAIVNKNYKEVYGTIMTMPNGELTVLECYLTAKYHVFWDVDFKITEEMKNNNKLENKFVDISAEHWAYHMMEKMVAKGYFKGYEDGTFRPENTITRAEVAQILSRFFQLAPVEERDIQDVAKEHWGYEDIQRASLYIPMVATSFEPEKAISRKDFVVAIMNYQGFQTEAVENKFSDLEGLEQDVIAKIYAACEAGIINGYEDGTFRPNDFLTRAEACAILTRIKK